MRLIEIQKMMKVEKDSYNKFGKYKYRTCSDIIEAFKRLDTGLVLLMNDEVVECGGRVFVKATVSLLDNEGSVASSQAFAETGEMAGMSAPQTTGAASTYARKYALCGLFAIDDSAEDPDNEKNQHKPEKEPRHDAAHAAANTRQAVPDAKIENLISWAMNNGWTYEMVVAKYDLTAEQDKKVKYAIL